MIWRGAAILTAVVIAAVPWGLPGETTFVLPFLTLLLVFVFSVHPKSAVPGWLVFAAGLATDVLTAGPLGYWAFIYMLCHALARAIAARAPVQTLPGLWIKYSGAALLAAMAGWGLAVVYYVRLIDWWPIALGTLVSIAVSPLVGWALRRSWSPGRGYGLNGAG
jgi:cell shape-determining protein MreD